MKSLLLLILFAATYVVCKSSTGVFTTRSSKPTTTPKPMKIITTKPITNRATFPTFSVTKPVVTKPTTTPKPTMTHKPTNIGTTPPITKPVTISY